MSEEARDKETPKAKESCPNATGETEHVPASKKTQATDLDKTPTASRKSSSRILTPKLPDAKKTFSLRPGQSFSRFSPLTSMVSTDEQRMSRLRSRCSQANKENQAPSLFGCRNEPVLFKKRSSQATLAPLKTLSQHSDLAVQKTLKEDWNRMMYSPRPGKLPSQTSSSSTFGYWPPSKRQSFASLTSIPESVGELGSFNNDSSGSSESSSEDAIEGRSSEHAGVATAGRRSGNTIDSDSDDDAEVGRAGGSMAKVSLGNEKKQEYSQ